MSLQALGVHAHSGDDEHDHSGEGIVIEPYVWYAVVACAGTWRNKP